MSPPTVVLRLPPGPQRVSGPRHERLVRRPAVAPRDELHVHGGGIGVAVTLDSTSSCSTNAGQQLAPRLPLSGADEDGAADLVQHRGGALLVRRVDDLGFEGIDRRQLLLAAVQPQRSRCR